MIRAFLISLITLYQKTISPDHGWLRHFHPYGFCRHEPTCSENMKQQIRSRGAFIGLFLGMRQLMTCHPWREPNEKRVRSVIEKM